MNEFLFFVTILANFTGVLLFYRLFGKAGLFAWVAFASIIANIETAKCVDIFGLSVTLGNVMFGTTFLATDILSELYGGKTARKAVLIGFSAVVVFFIATRLSLLYVPNSSDYAHSAMTTVFAILPRLLVASVISYAVSNTLDTYLYDAIRKRFAGDKYLWLRNNGSTMVSQLIDTLLCTLLAFTGVYPWGVVVELCITSYIIKVIIAACDTPFLYVAKRIGVKQYAG